MNIKKIIDRLSIERPVFHSEDDLKFALSQEIKNLYPAFSIWLERPVKIKMIKKDQSTSQERKAIDIVIRDEEKNKIPIELKYKTIKTNNPIIWDNEEYKLTNQGATDIGRVHFRKDIYRIEQFLNLNPDNSRVGYVLIITNDNDYRADKSLKNVLNSNYNFSNGDIPLRDPDWNYDAIDKKKYSFDEKSKKWVYNEGSKKAHWTCEGQMFYKLDLQEEYSIEWKLYSSHESEEDFYYCLIQILSRPIA